MKLLKNIKTCDISNFDNVELKLNGIEKLLLVSSIFKLLNPATLHISLSLYT